MFWDARQPLHTCLPHDNTTIEVRLIPSDMLPTVQSKPKQMSSTYVCMYVCMYVSIYLYLFNK